MKRLLHAAGVAAVAAALCLTTATSAGAATGTLTLNGRTISDPHGCYNADRSPMSIGNQTDENVYVYRDSDCSGYPVGLMPPGQDVVFNPASSVYVR
ncbi:hypothetical protein LN042_15610 [Kitasatospora sp. RB6PN24]|uniref:hypothetical protein n=1 Tax=Kitasatospora humi TaxID=2893891 RepID=UPI001E4BDF58|nr:hypothetical protein [Kitasatospora humi]MCC9308497.1 hypothetical protein [Kitasatospora humi]